MNRRYSRIVVAVVATGVSLVGPAREAGAIHEECFDDPIPGTVVQEGFPTTSPPSHYRITTGGFEVTIGPVGTLGTFHVEVAGNEVGLEVSNSLETLRFAADVSGGTTVGNEWEAALCLEPGGRSYYLDVDDPIPSRPGVTVRLFACEGGATWTCNTTVLGHTGAEVNLGVPLASCLWIDGRQQNLVATCPTLGGGSGLPL